MIKLIKEEKEHDNKELTYSGYGYETKISIYSTSISANKYLSIDTKCEYKEHYPYPMIKYNQINNQMEGIFNSFFSLTENNKEEWVKAIENAHKFIKEMNEIIRELIEAEEIEIFSSNN